MAHDKGLELSSGQLFADRYLVGDKLGEGSFGQVYQATLQSTGQQVAVKLLRLREGPSFPALDKQLSRFEREVKLGARLHHPHIVRVLDSGVADNGVIYSVFDYVPGQTLAQWLKARGHLALPTAERIMAQVLDALACAHGLDIVHRDLKPSNIMISQTGIQAHALVLDFGLAGLSRHGAHEELARLTGTRESLGTPAYAAPEQLRGEAASPQSDLYSWGLIFIECITGKRVMAGKGLPDVLFKQLGPEPVQVPAAVRNQPLGLLLRRVLSKNVAERVVTIAELLSTLDGGRFEANAPTAEPTPSSGAGTSSSSGSASWHTEHGEVRQVTAVSLRMSIPTTLADELGFESIDELVRARQELVAELAERFGAFLSGTLSDRQMVFFGYPRAAENDVRRAAGYSLAIHEHLARLPRAEEIGMHIGMHTGMVVAGDISRNPGLGSLTGATPLIATQLEAVAGAGVTLTTQDTRLLLERWYTFEAAEVGNALSSSGRHTTYKLVGKRELRGDAYVRYAASKIVGREQEIELLSERWKSAIAGNGQLVLVTAEAGIGKSRLVSEFVQRVSTDSDANWLEARCAPEDTNSAARPLIGMLERMLDVHGESEKEGRLERLEAALSALGFELADNVPLLAMLLGINIAGRYPHPQIEPKALKARTLDLLAGLLVATSANKPILLVVEDLHWADPTTIEFLNTFIEKLEGAAICAVFTARPEFTPPWEAAQFSQVQLGRLSEASARDLINEMTDGRQLPDEVIAMAVRRTDGVALFVEELVRHLLESELLQLEGNRYTLTGSLEKFDIPSTLRASLMARLDRLGDAKSTAQLAAALGREFNLELLRRISTMEAAAFDQAVEALRDAGLLQRRRRFAKGSFLFKHALVRDIAYDSIPQRTRPLIHGRIAEAIHDHFPDILEKRPELVAHHYGESGNNKRALHYTRVASKALFSRSAAFEAIEQANKGFAWLEGIDDEKERAKEELSLLGVLNPAVMMTKGWISDEAKTNIDRAQQLLSIVDDEGAAVGAMWAQLNYNHMTGKREEARKFARGLVERAEQAGDTDALVSTLPQLGHCLWIDGNYADARPPLERAVELYDYEAHKHHAQITAFDSCMWAEVALTQVLWAQGYPDAALKVSEASIASAERANHMASLSLAYNFHSMLLLNRGQTAEAMEYAGKVFVMGEKYGLEGHMGYAAMLSGIGSDNAEQLAGVIGFVEQLGFEMGLSYYRMGLAKVHASKGEYDSAIKVVDETIAKAQGCGELYNLAELLGLRGLLSFKRDSSVASAAEESIREGLKLADEQQAKTLQLRIASMLAQLLHATGRTNEVEALLTPVIASLDEGHELTDMQMAKQLLEGPLPTETLGEPAPS